MGVCEQSMVCLSSGSGSVPTSDHGLHTSDTLLSVSIDGRTPSLSGGAAVGGYEQSMACLSSGRGSVLTSDHGLHTSDTSLSFSIDGRTSSLSGGAALGGCEQSKASISEERRCGDEFGKSGFSYAGNNKNVS